MKRADLAVLTGTDVAANAWAGGSWQTNSSWVWWYQSASTSSARAAGYRFKPPADLDADELFNATITFAVNLAGALSTAAPFDILVEPYPSVPWANTTTDRPTNRFEAALTAGAQTIEWQLPDVVPGDTLTTPDLSELVAAAVNHPEWVPGESYLGFIIRGRNENPHVGSQIHAGTAPVQWRPWFRLEWNWADNPYDPIAELNVDYGPAACDIYTPGGQPPPGGWPTVVWLHGGSWRTGFGGRGEMPITWKDWMIAKGIAVINAGYQLVQSDILLNNTGPSFPMPIHNMRQLFHFFADDRVFWRVNPDKMVVTGQSAGGHVAAWTVASQGDTNVYTGRQNSAGNRGQARTRTRPQFDLDGGFPPSDFKGAFAWVAPIDVDTARQNPNPVSQVVVELSRTGYMGERQGINPWGDADELDLNHYIAGDSNVYGGPARPLPAPIGLMTGDRDELILDNSNRDVLIEAMTATGQPVTVDEPNTEGVSLYSVDSIHDNPVTHEEGWPDFWGWLEAILELETSTSPWRPQIVHL